MSEKINKMTLEERINGLMASSDFDAEILSDEVHSLMRRAYEMGKRDAHSRSLNIDITELGKALEKVQKEIKRVMESYDSKTDSYTYCPFCNTSARHIDCEGEKALMLISATLQKMREDK